MDSELLLVPTVPSFSAVVPPVLMELTVEPFTTLELTLQTAGNPFDAEPDEMVMSEYSTIVELRFGRSFP